MNKEIYKERRNTFYTLRTVIGTLMAITGFAVFVLSAMVNVIEPSALTS